jgi:hypothetical protein
MTSDQCFEQYDKALETIHRLQARINAMLAKVEEARSLCDGVTHLPRGFGDYLDEQFDTIRDAGQPAPLSVAPTYYEKPQVTTGSGAGEVRHGE